MSAEHYCRCSFDLDGDHNQLAALTTESNELFFVGKFYGSQDFVFQKKGSQSGIFVYQIDGTCEVHGRLLLPGDGLSLKNVETVEFEALAGEAIVFIAAVPSPIYLAPLSAQ